jgi:lysylphosphatidylglycerol synthetase-like protein (DUF2156 family)
MLRRRFPAGIQLSQDAYDTGPIRWPLTRHPATRRTRWLWLVPLVAGFATVFGIVIAQDRGAGLSLTNLGWFTIVLAALLVVLLAIHRNAGQMLRAIAEYLVVALLAVLLVTTTGRQPTQAPAPAEHPPSHAGATAKSAVDACPAIVHVRDWLTCLWNASQDAARRSHPSTTAKPKDHAMAPTPTPPRLSRRTHELV